MLIVMRYLHLKNGDYVPDNSMNFRHGTSEILPLNEAITQVEAILNATRDVETIIVFHDARADLAMMKTMGLKCPETCQVVDTRNLYAARQGSSKGDFTSLSKMMDRLGILALALHNAGNVCFLL